MKDINFLVSAASAAALATAYTAHAQGTSGAAAVNPPVITN
ncbi:hypothetical protein NUH86_12770 [Sphingobium sp. JS3065]|jgi:hypothetical protein|nr:hypothetical protein [Sphingobium sp. JS3065]UZW54379.1 hypothetical protein NUH86_12770 [Sphingobium sp. JS3065]